MHIKSGAQDLFGSSGFPLYYNVLVHMMVVYYFSSLLMHRQSVLYINKIVNSPGMGLCISMTVQWSPSGVLQTATYFPLIQPLTCSSPVYTK